MSCFLIADLVLVHGDAFHDIDQHQ